MSFPSLRGEASICFSTVNEAPASEKFFCSAAILMIVRTHVGNEIENRSVGEKLDPSP